MLVFIILEIGYTLEDLDELLSLVLFLIQFPDILRGELSVERHAQNGLNPAEPWADGRNERNFHSRT